MKPSSEALWPQLVLLSWKNQDLERSKTSTPPIQNALFFQACQRPEHLPKSTEVSLDSCGQALCVPCFWGRVRTLHPHCTKKEPQFTL